MRGRVSMARPRHLKLAAFMRPASIHTGAWRYPGAFPDANFNFAHLKRFAQTLERGKFDAFFMADHLAVLNIPLDALKRSHTVTSYEPFTLLSALAGVTEHLGLAATGPAAPPPPARLPSTRPITSRADSPRSIISAAAAPAGTSSPPPIPTPRAISASPITWSTASATPERASSTTW